MIFQQRYKNDHNFHIFYHKSLFRTIFEIQRQKATTFIKYKNVICQVYVGENELKIGFNFYKPIYSNDIFIDLKFFLDIYVFAFISQDGSSIQMFMININNYNNNCFLNYFYRLRNNKLIKYVNCSYHKQLYALFLNKILQRK